MYYNLLMFLLFALVGCETNQNHVPILDSKTLIDKTKNYILFSEVLPNNEGYIIYENANIVLKDIFSNYDTLLLNENFLINDIIYNKQIYFIGTIKGGHIRKNNLYGLYNFGYKKLLDLNTEINSFQMEEYYFYFAVKNKILVGLINDKVKKTLIELPFHFSIQNFEFFDSGENILINCRDILNFKSLVFKYNIKTEELIKIIESDNNITFGNFINDIEFVYTNKNRIFLYNTTDNKTQEVLINDNFENMVINEIKYFNDELILMICSRKDIRSSFNNIYIYFLNNKKLKQLTNSDSYKTNLVVINNN